MRSNDKMLSELKDEAIKQGASSVKVIDAKDIIIDKRARLKCAIPLCPSYDSHLLCPPNLMAVEEFKEIIGLYEKALILQVEADYDSLDKSDKELDGELCELIENDTRTPEWELKLHKLVNRLEASAFKRGFRFAAGLIGGECSLCKECVGVRSEEACRHPFRARPSMEAMGIDVHETCAKAGLPLSLSSSDRVRWTGIILLY